MNDFDDIDFTVPESEGKKLLAGVQSGRTDDLPDSERKLADKLLVAIADLSTKSRDELVGTLNRLNPQELFTVIKIIVSVRKKNLIRFFRFILFEEDDAEAEKKAERNRNWSEAATILSGPAYYTAMSEAQDEYMRTGLMPD